MSKDEARRERLTRAVQELGTSIREAARERWKGVRTAHRRERSREVWRFRREDSEERFLHVPQNLILRGPDAAKSVMGQLREAEWLERMQSGPETSFVLSASGRLQPWPNK